jgi:hypothetical protein
MNTENQTGKGKSNRIWGWIMTILGGVFTVVSLFFISQAYYEVDVLGSDPLYLITCYCTVPGLILGIILLVLGIRWIISGKGNKYDWGWVLTIVGWFPILLGILLIFYSLSSGRNLEISELLFSASILLIGIFLVVIGTRIIQKGKRLRTNPGVLANPQERVEK